MRYFIRKYVEASSIEDALLKEKKAKVDGVWSDESPEKEIKEDNNIGFVNEQRTKK
jgi:hypothetical protein